MGAIETGGFFASEKSSYLMSISRIAICPSLYLYILCSLIKYTLIKMKSVIALALVGSAAAFAPQAQGPVSIYILLCTLF